MGGIGFDLVEYSVFAAMMGLSALIGVYFGFIKGGQDTVDGYLLGGKKMGLIPISISLTSSSISGVTILGIPTEIYTYGTQYMAAVFCFFTVSIICAIVFLPVFHKLQIISVYEYLELRFNQKVRRMVSFFYTLSLLIYIPVVIYGPALALNQVTGQNIHGTSLLVSAVCIFYTTFGGLKAVVWTDTLQAVVMVASCVVVAIIGTSRVGGLGRIFEIAAKGDRLEMFNLDPSPFERATFWTIVVGVTMSWTSGTAISPSVVQRFVSLSTVKKAQWSVLWFHIGCFIFFSLSCFMGLVIYAHYHSCDPRATGMIKSADQIVPFFILDAVGDYRGLPGLFLAGVVSAALSTMSCGLNTVAGTMYEDFIEPMLGKTTDRRASNIMKVLSAVFGVLCVLLVMVIEKLGSLLELTNAVGALTAGAILGIFILGVFFPQATSLGAFVGGLSGLVVLSWVITGSRAAFAAGDLVYPSKPISVQGCSFNLTDIHSVVPPGKTSEDVFRLYELSVFLYVTLGTVITVIVGLITSYLTGANKVESVDRSLLTPVIHRFLPEYRPVPAKEVELKEMPHIIKDGR